MIPVYQCKSNPSRFIVYFHPSQKFHILNTLFEYLKKGCELRVDGYLKSMQNYKCTFQWDNKSNCLTVTDETKQAFSSVQVEFNGDFQNRNWVIGFHEMIESLNSKVWIYQTIQLIHPKSTKNVSFFTNEYFTYKIYNIKDERKYAQIGVLPSRSLRQISDYIISLDELLNV